MFKRFSHKDLLLLLGILVAAVIALTTVVFSEHPVQAKTPAPPLEKTSSISNSSRLFRRLIEKVVPASTGQSSSLSR